MALVTTDNAGEGQIVDTRTVGRPVGDTSSSAIFLTDLPKNFHGGDEALHFALGELFGQYGKIKKIELYMEKGILDTENFKGEALVVYHKIKQTGSHDKGDPVYDACTDLDGRWRMLGKRGWRIRCEAAVWQKEGYDAKSKAKLYPCVEISNLWEYDPSLPMAWFSEMQEAIRKHAGEHIEAPFVKVEPSAGSATIWVKGAQDAMKFASLMHKSYFLGRKVVAALCRKEKPISAPNLKVPTELSMMMPTDVWDGSGPIPGASAAAPVGPAPPSGTDLFTSASEQQHHSAELLVAEAPVAGPAAPLTKGQMVTLTGLVAKPENNGRQATVMSFLEELGKYQVMLDDGRSVKVKPENLAAVEEEHEIAAPQRKKRRESAEEQRGEDPDDRDAAEAEAAGALEAAQAAAANMAAGNVKHGPESFHDPLRDGFLATVCVDPALLPKREEPEPEETRESRRDRSRSRERRQQERIAGAKARLESEKAPRPSWILPSPEELAAQQREAAAKGGGAAGGATQEPEQSREELSKLSVGKLKELLKQFGKSARNCLEKQDFVDRLKPAAKV